MARLGTASGDRAMASAQRAYDNATPEECEEEAASQFCGCGEELGEGQEKCVVCGLREELARLRALCAARPGITYGSCTEVADVIAEKWIDQIDAAGRGEGGE
jgi:hypothetical protein